MTLAGSKNYQQQNDLPFEDVCGGESTSLTSFLHVQQADTYRRAILGPQMTLFHVHLVDAHVVLWPPPTN